MSPLFARRNDCRKTLADIQAVPQGVRHGSGYGGVQGVGFIALRAPQYRRVLAMVPSKSSYNALFGATSNLRMTSFGLVRVGHGLELCLGTCHDIVAVGAIRAVLCLRPQSEALARHICVVGLRLSGHSFPWRLPVPQTAKGARCKHIGMCAPK
jgi:hypothetical protein